MHNVRGPEGVINLTGRLGDPAELVSIDAPDFYDNIEDGIISTVRLLVDNGFITTTSCQGHFDKRFFMRTVTVRLNKNEIEWWRLFISEMNILGSFREPVTYHILKTDKENEFDLMILFGSVYDIDETIIKQKKFEDNIPTIRSMYYSRKDPYKDYSSNNKHINERIDFE